LRAQWPTVFAEFLLIVVNEFSDTATLRADQITAGPDVLAHLIKINRSVYETYSAKDGKCRRDQKDWHWGRTSVPKEKTIIYLTKVTAHETIPLSAIKLTRISGVPLGQPNEKEIRK